MAAILSKVLDRHIEHVNLSHGEFRKFLASKGISQYMSEYLADLDVAVASGHGSESTDVVQRVTGNAPRSFYDFALDNKSHWV